MKTLGSRHRLHLNVGWRHRLHLNLVIGLGALFFVTFPTEAQTPPFTVSGQVVEGTHSTWIGGATVRLSDAYTNFGGSFRIKDLPQGHSIPILVSAYEYLPARISLITERDTTLSIELQPDSLGIRLFAAAERELEIRTAAVPLSLLAFNRDYLERSPGRSVYDVIKWRIGRDFTTSCLFIDEIKQFHTDILDSYNGGVTKRILDSYNAGELERVEVFQRGRMIRVYTRHFVARKLGWSKAFPPIFFLPGGIGPDTCY